MKFKTFTWIATFLISIALAGSNAQSQTRTFRPNTTPSRESENAKPDNTAEAEYRLGPEDLIEVFVWKEPDLTTSVPVRPDGKVSLPLTGELDASGKTTQALQTEIAGKLQRYVTTPVVNVIVKEVNSQKISVLGEVRKPDLYRIKQRITLLDAIALAGGFTDFAKKNHVIVIRNGPSGQQRIQLNLDRTLKAGGESPFFLQPLDTVYVE